MVFSTVNTFIETVGRTRTTTFADLDTLTAIWTGPTSLSDVVPKIGAVHPQYPNMELRAQHKVADVGNITRIQLDYCGLFSGDTIGIVAKGFTTQTGELEYQQSFGVPVAYTFVNQPSQGPQGTVPQTQSVTYLNMKYGLQSFVATYVSRSWTYRYCAKNASMPRFDGGDILSVTTRGGAQSSITYALVQAGSLGPSSDALFPGVVFGYREEIFCSSFNAEPMSPSWFRCTEVWSARLVAG